MLGRPKLFDKRTIISHTQEWQDRADKEARKLKITRAEFIRRATDAYEVMDAPAL